ncbi:MAG: NTP transferase domain-containing protein [Limnochordales bacterium]|nr:NTP transferase domain-containing protein [Limnochordales bacterium]
MQAIVPVAGIGTRLRPHTHTVPKALVSVAGKPILGHILDQLLPLGIDEVILVVGYLGDKIVNYVNTHYQVAVRFVEQEERLGLGHAIYLTREVVRPEEPVLIVLGDTIFRADLGPVLKGSTSALGVKAVDNPRNFGVVELDASNRIRRLVEKPSDPPSNLAIVGLYFIRNPRLLFQGLEEIIRRNQRVKGEFQLTDGLQYMLEAGEEFTTFFVNDWFDCGNPRTLLETNHVLLSENTVHYQPGETVVDSIIIPPVSIAPTARVRQSVIGPYVSIGDDAEIVLSVVKESIINEGARVSNVVLSDSVVGERAVVEGTFTSLNIGDSSEIRIGR